MRYLFPLILALAAAAHAGTVSTKDGQTLTGDLVLSEDAIKVTPKGAPAKTISLKEVASATFADPAGQTSTYPAPRRDAQFDPVRRVLVEYFADEAFKDRRLARYESSFYTHWNDAKNMPDPAIPYPCFIRFTASLSFPRATQCSFHAQCYGPVRLSVDQKVVFDNFGKRVGDHSAGTAAIAANTPVTLRMETGVAGHLYLARLLIANRVMQGDMFNLPPDAPAPPAVSGAVTGDVTHFRSPASIGFDAKVTHPGKITSVDLVCDHECLATATTAPYHLEWKAPAAGIYNVRVRATDDKGISGYSLPITIGVADSGDKNSLPAPWGQQTLGRPGQIQPGSASFAKGTFTLTKAGGQITEGDDAPQFIYQPVDGDFTLVAHLKSLAPENDIAGPLAGVMIREGMGPTDRFAAIVAGPQAVQFARRVEYWGRPTSTDAGEGAAPAKTGPFQAKWLKILRHGNRIRTYTSTDGATWSLAGADRIELPQRVYVGLCNMSRDVQTPSTATFEKVTLIPGPPAMASSAQGILFRSGTFLAAEVLGIEKTGALAFNRNGKRVYMQNHDVARFIYKPISAEIAEKLADDRTGVLLGSGDFIEGELKEVSYHAVVSNVLFGPRTFILRGGDALAVYIKAPDAPAGPYIITATDGSLYQSKTLSITGQTIHLEDPALGAVELPTAELARLKMN